MSATTQRTEEAPPVTLLVRCPECQAGALLRDVEDGKCPWCGFKNERQS